MTSIEPEQPVYPEQPFGPMPTTNTLAIVSIVSSFFVGIAGLIALAQIKARGEAGRVLALAGIIIGSITTMFTLMVVVLLLAFAATWSAAFSAVTNGGAGGGAGGDTSTSSPTPSPSSTNIPGQSAPSSDLPTGRVGAADFDAGYLTVGTGPVTVDVYFDVMCPYCRQFEETNGTSLALGANNDAITLRLHSLTFLDRLSQGTNYSTRASSALTCHATLNPNLTLDYLAALFANQPAENTVGLSDSELVALVPGGTSIADCLASGAYDTWSQVNTEAAIIGPIDGAEIPSIPGTPTVLVDGALYEGSLTDPVEFAQFVSSFFTS
ncbi:thioredoxin domain-containing protein [Cryobacterium sp. CG_9.6]|uniref:thioredoxin domain-containing protein n=1 Tax=Cryobacterium sp. CG_9.6 TaxID=2760710 RepID=UPI0024733525|nr:thioredoxin domain-containing protein [Cryobacterium sp. CG_9.6]MDH6236872.1 protein-disulfide isomerase [Cryobacterium sp. CG_9.6]